MQSRTCNICGHYMTGGIDGFKAHGIAHHPNCELKVNKSRAYFCEKKYYCPLDNNWYSCLKWLSRTITKFGWTNEKYYLTYGEQWLPDKWRLNSSRLTFGHRHCSNTCLQCNTKLAFDERKWVYPVFCGFKCSTTWYAQNTNRVSQAQSTLKQRKLADPDYGLIPSQWRYWVVVHNMTEEQAKQKQKERQSINKLEDFIKRANGDIELGTALFKQRQERWLTSLKKTNMKKGTSKSGDEFFNRLSNHVPELVFGRNNEAVIQISGTAVKVDCLYPATNKIIEYYGDYWHGNPQKFKADDKVAIRKIAKDVWQKDKDRIQCLRDAGYDALIVWENEYKKDPSAVIERCIHYLNN